MWIYQVKYRFLWYNTPVTHLIKFYGKCKNKTERFLFDNWKHGSPICSGY